MTKKTFIAIAAFSAFLCTADVSPAQQGKTNANYLARYETHDQAGNGDFLYNGAFFSKDLQNRYNAVFYYLNKYSLDEDQTESHIFNMTVNNQRTPKLKLTYGYSHYSNPDVPVRRPVGNDSDRWLIMGQYMLKKSGQNQLAFNTSLSTGTDFSDSRTLNVKLRYGFPLGQKATGALHGQYSYSMNLNEDAFNIYGLDLGYNVSKALRLSANYLLVDMQLAGIEDDNIIQVGVFNTIR